MFYVLYQFAPLIIHNFFYYTLALIAGIIFAHTSNHFYSIPILIFGIIFLVLYQKCYKVDNLKLLLVLPLFILGSLLYQRQKNLYNNFFTQVNTQTPIEIRGLIQSIDYLQDSRMRYRILINLNYAKAVAETNWKKNNSSIALYTQKVSDFLVGDYIEVRNLAMKTNKNFSFTQYLIKEKIAATGFLDKSVQHSLINRPTISFARTIFYFRKSLFNTLQRSINYQTFALFSSIFLGNRFSVKKQMENTKEYFKVWGISHYLARSGLHLVIFIMIWHFLFGLMPIFSYFKKQLCLIVFILSYALLSWSSISFERALYTFLFYKLCLLSSRPYHYVHIILLVTFITLCINPFQLFFLDFQLSFSLTFALAWFSHIQAHKTRLSQQSIV